jgi:NhaP-type Na+/H+ or K+/H+ antiporter
LDQQLPGGDILMATVIWTIFLSILLHGITANPLARWYGARTAQRAGKI